MASSRPVRVRRSSTGEAVDTAYALLFLKRATTGLPGNDGGGVVKIPHIERLKANWKREQERKEKEGG